MTWKHCNDKGSKEECSQRNLQKKINFWKFRVLQLFRESWFSAVIRGLANLTATETLHGIITKTKFIYLKTYRRKTARRAIISEICILRNFAFYNFC